MKSDVTVVDVGSVLIPTHETTDRKKLGKFVRTYLLTAIRKQGMIGVTISTLSESTIAQAQHDCLKFYWANRHDIEVLLLRDPTYTLREVGRDFYLSRHYRQQGFVTGSADEHFRLHKSAQAWARITLYEQEISE